MLELPWKRIIKISYKKEIFNIKYEEEVRHSTIDVLFHVNPRRYYLMYKVPAFTANLVSIFVHNFAKKTALL